MELFAFSFVKKKENANNIIITIIIIHSEIYSLKR